MAGLGNSSPAFGAYRPVYTVFPLVLQMAFSFRVKTFEVVQKILAVNKNKFIAWH